MHGRDLEMLKPYRTILSSIERPNQLSVIVPIYNGVKQGLKTCLTSLVEQTFNDMDVICIDDYSSDNSVNTARVILEKRGWELIKNNRNFGLAATLNNGIKHSQSAFVMILQQDCYLIDKKSIEMALLEFEKDKTIGVIVGKQKYDFNNLNFYQKVMEFRLEHFYLNLTGEKYIDLTENKCDIIKRDALSKIGLFEESLRISGEDQVFSAKMRSQGYKILLSDKLLYKNSLQGESTFFGALRKEIVYGKYSLLLLLKLKNTPSKSNKNYKQRKYSNKILSVVFSTTLGLSLLVSFLFNFTWGYSIGLMALLLRGSNILLRFRRLKKFEKEIKLSKIKTVLFSFLLDFIFTLSLIYGAFKAIFIP